MNWLIEPPYSLLEAIKWSFLVKRAVNASCWAACPEEQATAAVLFSKLEILSSNTETVGLVSLE